MSREGGNGLFNLFPSAIITSNKDRKLPNSSSINQQPYTPPYSPPFRTNRLESIPPELPTKSPIKPTASTSTSSTTIPIKVPNLLDLPLSPLPHHLDPFLSHLSPLSDEEKRELFTNVYLKSASSGNSDTLEWLLSIPNLPSTSSNNGSPSSSYSPNLYPVRRGSLASSLHEIEFNSDLLDDTIARKWIDLERRDEEGNTALTLCVALGHAEGVRVLVEGGVDVSSTDKAGWTALHWAVQNNDIPITSYLLNHRASANVPSLKGLRPKDLVKRGRDGAAMRDYLQSAEEATRERDLYLASVEDPTERAAGDYLINGVKNGKGKGREDLNRPSSRASMSSLGSTSKPHGWSSQNDKVEEERKEREMQKRMEMAMESAQILEVDLHILGLGGGGGMGSGTRGSSAPQDDEEEGIPNPFIWDRCLPDQMIVFSLDDLSIIFDVVITNMKPVRARLYRVIPANVVFLCARFAHYFGSRELLDELFLGAIERIEAAVHHRPDDMANCAFWLSNTLLLLYYLRKEPNLFASTSDFQIHLSDLVNEIFVFVIRDAERRIDRVLETAMLEFEGVPGFEDVQFEGDWSGSRFVKKLTGRGKKTLNRSSSTLSIFANAPSINDPVSPGSVGSIRDSSLPASPNSRATFNQTGPTSSNLITSPRTITALLSSTLFILQIYEIPPSIVVQAFSQLFYWISCEVFNRLLTQKKYLCRSKAIQIRLNASSLEDWSRLNLLPSRMVSVHFAPLNQLLQWLQCLSSESSIDGLIGTIQSLRSLNPLQLNKAVKEYRYEVDESRMSEECSLYLAQIQKQWERVKAQKTLEELEISKALAATVAANGSAADSVRSNSPTGSMISIQSDVSKMIDDVFSDPEGFGHYSPPGGAEALGELLNSRYMLPFAVPSSAEMLVNFRNKDAFGPFAPPSHASLRPSISNSSFQSPLSKRLSTQSVQYATSNLSHDFSDTTPTPSPSASTTLLSTAFFEDKRFVPVLPDDFFAVLDASKAHHYGISAAVLREREHTETDENVDGDTSGATTNNTSSSTVEEWFDWREHSSTEISLPVENDEEDEAYGVLETPRQRAGFESSPFGGSS